MAIGPIPILLIFFFLKENHSFSIPAINTLQVEAMLDNVKGVLNTIDKISSFGQFTQEQQLPDMKKLMELAGPVLAAMNTTSNDD